jgi:SPP1 gp7 family putative phage head morphogenesis protein
MPDGGFWSAEEELLFNAIYDTILASTYQAYANGFEALGADVPVGLDFELINQDAQRFALNHTAVLAGEITATSRVIVQEKVAQWIGSGEGLGKLVNSLEPWFGANRAEMIAVTETTRAYAEGNIRAWQAAGFVDGKRWMTNRDDIVCPICRPLDNQVVQGLAEPGFSDDGGLGIHAPPAHVRCRCWLQPVVDIGATDLLGAEEVPFEPSEPDEIEQLEAALRAAGIPVSEAYNYLSRGDLHKFPKHVLGLIDQIHGDGDLTQIPIKWTASKKVHGQFYKGAHFVKEPDGSTSIHYKALHITLAKNPDHPLMTLAHEMGHHLDYEAFGQKGRSGFSSEKGGADGFGDVLRAIEASDEFQQIRAMYDDPSGNMLTFEWGTVAPDRSHLSYLSTPRELWARAYSQYIAVRSGDPDMLAELNRLQNNQAYPQQWSDKSFEPVANAVDTMLQDAGYQEVRDE